MKFSGLAGLVLAAVLGANTAMAGFIPIDSFDDSGSSEIGTRLTGSGNSVGVTISGGTARFEDNNAFQRYKFDPNLSSNLYKFKLRLKGVDISTLAQPESAVVAKIFLDPDGPDPTPAVSMAVNLAG